MIEYHVFNGSKLIGKIINTGTLTGSTELMQKYVNIYGNDVLLMIKNAGYRVVRSGKIL